MPEVHQCSLGPQSNIIGGGNAVNDSAPSISSVGVTFRDGGRVMGNSKPSVDLWGSKAPSTVGRPVRGTLMRMKATPKGSVDNVNDDLPENPLEDWNEEQMSQCQMRRKDSAERTSDRRTSGQQYAPDGPESWNKGVRRRSAGNSQKYRESERDSDAGKVSGRDMESSYGGSGSQIRKMREEDEEDYRRDKKPANGYTNFEERTRSYRIEEDAQMLNEEEEGFLRTRDMRDMQDDYFDDECNSWEENDVRTSGSLYGPKEELL
ncbi:hypothetical protein R1sor_014857 [Riccia sorocarpa]|uniref:Uncharacterized protein n=1 Tax=Riccia sorocarpa TaxID=122646 RepID=A0ABD3HAK8_9MARC